MKNPNLKFIFGIVLIICGWIICFDLFLLMIGLAFFLLGTILVLTAKKKLWVKVLTIGLPILLWFIGFEIILHEISKPGSLTILIPENYTGEFRIIEGEKNGVVPTQENGRTTLRIPENGVLITQAHLNLHQNTDFEFYFVGADNNKTKISGMKMWNEKNVKFPAVLFNGILSPMPMPGVSSDVARPLDYLYDDFIVYREQPASASVQSNKDKLTDSLVKIERRVK